MSAKFAHTHRYFYNLFLKLNPIASYTEKVNKSHQRSCDARHSSFSILILCFIFHPYPTSTLLPPSPNFSPKSKFKLLSKGRRLIRSPRESGEQNGNVDQLCHNSREIYAKASVRAIIEIPSKLWRSIFNRSYRRNVAARRRVEL